MPSFDLFKAWHFLYHKILKQLYCIKEAITENAMEPLVEMPPLVNAKKLTIVTWSVIFGTILYVILRLILRKPIAAVLQPFAKKANSQYMDEIGYRSVLIGFPVFTLAFYMVLQTNSFNILD